jgi:hypothetical protein
MRTFISKAKLFLIIFFVVEKGVYYFLSIAPNREYDKRLEYVLEGNMNKELIVLGSSKGAADILAGQLEKETGLESYNLSYQGSNVVFHEFILKTLLKYNQTPKKVILVVDIPYEFIEEKSLKFRVDRLYPLSKYNYINKELINQKEKNILSWVFCSGRVNQSNFEFKTIKPPHFNPLNTYGSGPYIVEKEKKDFNYSLIKDEYNIKNELPEKVKAFKNIQKLCSENNIELTFIIPPNFFDLDKRFIKRFKTLLTEDNKLFVYDTLNPIYRDEKYFNDYSHLFIDGAKILTSEISDFIINSNNK